MKKTVWLLTTVLILCAPGQAAAQLKLFVGGAVTEPVKKVDAEFAKKTGHRADLTSVGPKQAATARRCVMEGHGEQAFNRAVRCSGDALHVGPHRIDLELQRRPGPSDMGL